MISNEASSQVVCCASRSVVSVLVVGDEDVDESGSEGGYSRDTSLYGESGDCCVIRWECWSKIFTTAEESAK